MITSLQWVSVIRIAAKLAWRLFRDEVKKGARELAERERREKRDIDGDGGIGSIGGKTAILLIALTLYTAGCATLRPDGTPTWWGHIVIWVYPSVTAAGE